MSIRLLTFNMVLLIVLSNTTNGTYSFCDALQQYEFIFLDVNYGLQRVVIVAKCDYLLYFDVTKV